MKRVVLVGATDGIGRALASEYLRRGWWVGVVGRDPAKLEAVEGELADEMPGERVATAVCDVARPDDVEPAFRAIVRSLGQLDLLIYCAGVMPAAESLDDRLEAVGPLLAVNLEGAIRWIELAADYLVDAGRGRVAAIGSVAGVRGRKGNPVYGSAKAGLHQYLEGLRHRLQGTGVGVSTIMPGWVRTRMLGPEPSASRASITPERAARLIARGLQRGRDAFYVPHWWGLVAFALRIMPRFLYKRFAPA